MSAHATRISRRLLMAGGGAFGLGLLRAPAYAQTPEKITYLFPAPPILPAFGPIQLAALALVSLPATIRHAIVLQYECAGNARFAWMSFGRCRTSYGLNTAT